MAANALGYVPYRPQGVAIKLIDQIKEVLQEYRDHLPLTARQIFYRLVAEFLYPKTKAWYDGTLCRILNRARRGELIDFVDIRDDGSVVDEAPGYSSLQSFQSVIQREARTFRLREQQFQPWRSFVFCESAGMVPQIARVAHRYGVSVHSKGGYDSVTGKYEFAKMVHELDQPAVIYHLGDFDPSGRNIFAALRDDIVTFCKQMHERESDEEFVAPMFHRVALSRKHIDRFNLPCELPKVGKDGKGGDPRTKAWIEKYGPGETTCQLEALPPDEIAAIVERACTRAPYFDADVFAETKAKSRRQCEWLVSQLTNVDIPADLI